MQKDVHPVTSTFGMRGQNVLAVMFHLDSNERPNFENYRHVGI